MFNFNNYIRAAVAIIKFVFIKFAIIKFVNNIRVKLIFDTQYIHNALDGPFLFLFLFFPYNKVSNEKKKTQPIYSS